MDELDELKQRRIQELQQAQQEEQQVQHQIQQLESVVKQVMTKDALQRYGNVRSAHPEKAVQVLVALAQSIQQGKISQVDDALLKQLLLRLQEPKKEFKITRK